jgi:hypothetical protein
VAGDGGWGDDDDDDDWVRFLRTSLNGGGADNDDADVGG